MDFCISIGYGRFLTPPLLAEAVPPPKISIPRSRFRERVSSFAFPRSRFRVRVSSFAKSRSRRSFTAGSAGSAVLLVQAFAVESQYRVGVFAFAISRSRHCVAGTIVCRKGCRMEMSEGRLRDSVIAGRVRVFIVAALLMICAPCTGYCIWHRDCVFAFAIRVCVIAFTFSLLRFRVREFQLLTPQCLQEIKQDLAPHSGIPM